MEREIGWLLQEKYPEINLSDLNGASNSKIVLAAKKDIKRLKEGEPLDHIIGFVEFLDCKILVNKNVLIPRFETEFWTEKAIEEIKLSGVGHRTVLDMFAGSGCIGIAVLKHIKNSQLVFAESQKKALVQIKKSCAVNNILKNRYKIIQSDIFSNISGKFDYIFANPPYIPIVRRGKVQKSVLQYEPKEALFGGSDGLNYIAIFLREAQKFLNPGGKIYMEFDSIQRNKINMLLKKFRYKHWQFHKDQYDKWRWVTVNN